MVYGKTFAKFQDHRRSIRFIKARITMVYKYNIVINTRVYRKQNRKSIT